MIPSNVQSNLERVGQLLKKTPNATHVYLRTDDDRLVDIPINSAETTIRTKPKWVVENLATAEGKHSPLQNPWPSATAERPKTGVSAQIPMTPAIPGGPTVTLPPKPSESDQSGGNAGALDRVRSIEEAQEWFLTHPEGKVCCEIPNDSGNDPLCFDAESFPEAKEFFDKNTTLPGTVKSDYRVTKGFTHGGVEYKYRNVLTDLTEEEATAFPAGVLTIIKK